MIRLDDEAGAANGEHLDFGARGDRVRAAGLRSPLGALEANEAGGVNVNLLATSQAGSLERLAGMAHLNGIPVRVEQVAARPEPNGAARGETVTVSA